jgi:hypothetical protein
MRSPRALFSCLAIVVLCSRAAAGPELDPLQFVPDQMDAAIVVDHPRALVEGVLGNGLVKDVQALEAVRELYDSTNARRFYQLLDYFEQQLGTDRYSLLDRLTGGGVAFGIQFGSDPAPVVLVMQSKDEALLHRFFDLGVKLIDQELARQESKERIKSKAYHGIDTFHLGKDFHAALAGSALVISNREKMLEASLDSHRDKGKKCLAAEPAVADARRELGPERMAWLWVNLKKVQGMTQAKEVFRLPRNDFQITVLFGALLDVAGRAPYVCAGIYPEANGFSLSVRMPRGRDGMAQALVTHVPLTGGGGLLPLLEPKGVLFSTSYYLDLSKFWESRKRLFNEQQIKAFEDFDKNSAKFLAGTPFSKLAAMAGTHQRIVIVHGPNLDRKTKGAPAIPAGAFVLEMRDPAGFPKRMEAILRSAALLATTVVKLRLFEEDHAGCHVIGYRFADDSAERRKEQPLRYNSVPCFTAVGNQFLVCSSVDLCHELIDLLQRETKLTRTDSSPAVGRTRLYAAGGSEVLQFYKDRVLTQTMLDRAVPPEQAAKEAERFIALVRRLGTFSLEESFAANEFRFDLRLTTRAGGSNP